MNTSTIATILGATALGLMKKHSGSRTYRWQYDKSAYRFKGKNYTPRSLPAIYKLSQKKRDSIKWLEISSLFDKWQKVVTPERVYYKEVEPEFDANIFNMFPNLEALTILEDITSIPPEIGNLTKLEFLRIPCDDLLELPAEIGNLTNLKYLDISWCDKLISLPPEIGNLTNLVEIEKPSRNFLTEEFKTPPLILPKEIVHTPAFTGPTDFLDGRWGHSAWGNMLAFPRTETLRYWASHMHPISFKYLYEDLLKAAPKSQLRKF